MKSYERVQMLTDAMGNLDNGEFKKLMNYDRESNKKEFNMIHESIYSMDKYPRKIPEMSGLDEVKVSRSFNYSTEQNVVRLFTGPKKKQVLVAQYSAGREPNDLCNFLPVYELKNYDVDIFHHTDMDGDASASIIFNFIKKNRITDSVYTYRYNYNGKTIDDLITRANIRSSKTKRKNACFIVDLSLKAIEIMNILNSYETVVWIDHHQTSLQVINSVNPSNNVNKKFSYAIDSRCCATYLTLSIIKHQNDKIGNNLWYPKGNVGFKIAALINAYDLKLDKKYPEAYEIAKDLNQFYFDYKTFHSFSSVWKNAFLYDFSEADVIHKIFTAGKKLSEIERMKLQVLYDNDYIYDYTVNLFESNEENPYHMDKVRFRAIYGTGNSSRFIKDDSDIPEIDFIIRYRGDELVLVISAYTDNDVLGEVDLSKLFSKYNMGGGHKKACGGSIFTDDIYELLTKVGETIDKEYWKFGNDSSFNNFMESNTPDKMRYKNWKLNELKETILLDSNKKLWDFYKEQVEKQRPRYANDDDLDPIDPRVEYDIDATVRLLVVLYSIMINKFICK